MNPVVYAVINGIAVIFFAAIALWLLMGVLDSWAKKTRAAMKKAEPKVECVQCDCTADMKCPQGREPTAGNPYRCKIWRIV